jgi:Protein of unknown function (DUF3040)
VALNEADRLKLAEIERRLERDPTIARAFRRRRRTPWKLARSALCAVLAYLACLVVFSVVAGAGFPMLLALPPIAVMSAVLQWPGLLRLPVLRRPPR